MVRAVVDFVCQNRDSDNELGTGQFRKKKRKNTRRNISLPDHDNIM